MLNGQRPAIHRLGLALACLTIVAAAGSLATVGCAPRGPSGRTPVPPQASLWQVYTEAGEDAWLRGNYEEAERQYLAALREAEQLKVVAPNSPTEALADDPGLATSLNNLGRLYTDMERYSEAQSHLDRALTITETALGPDHPYVAVTLKNLATLHQANGRTAQAETLLRRALRIDERILGATDPQVGDDLNRLGEIAAAQQGWGDAEAFLRHGLGKYCRSASS